jgi:predicted alpha/beta hydrolase
MAIGITAERASDRVRDVSAGGNPNANRTLTRGALTHFGFFREAFAESLWHKHLASEFA